eukprot:1393940-Amorphochlora_amoeboformis.AAC.3
MICENPDDYDNYFQRPDASKAPHQQHQPNRMTTHLRMVPIKANIHPSGCLSYIQLPDTTYIPMHS